VLRCNLDETSVCIGHHGQRGVITALRAQDVVLLKDKPPKRGSLTHVALICDDPAVQPLLPQFILGNEHVLKVGEMQEQAGRLPDNVYVVRAKSSWVTTAVLCMILHTLRSCLKAKKIHEPVLLLWDTCPVHCHHLVWTAARKAKIFLCFVPASMTWLQQPLDVYVFRRFKARLRKTYRQMQSRRGAPKMRSMDVVLCIVDAIRNVLQGIAWGSSFEGCGFSLDGRACGTRLRRALGSNTGELVFAAREPSHDALRTILPRGRSYRLELLYHDNWTAQEEPEQEPVQHARAGNADEDGERNARPAMMGSPHVDAPCSQTESWQDRLRPRPVARRQHPPACVSPREEAASQARVASAAHPALPCQSSTSLPARVTMQQAHKRPAVPRPRALARARTARASTI